MDLYQKAYIEGQSEAYPRGWKEGMDEGYSSGHAGGFIEGRKAGIVEAAIKMVKNRKEPEPVPTVEIAIQTESSPLPSFASTLPSRSPAVPPVPPSRTSTPLYPDPDPDISWSDVIPARPAFDLQFSWSEEDNPLPPPMYAPRDFSDLRSDDVKNPFSSLSRRHHQHHKHSSARLHLTRSSSRFSSRLHFAWSRSHHTGHIPNWRSLKYFIHSVVLEATRTSLHLKGALGVGASSPVE
jgi:hypothetical protein